MTKQMERAELRARLRKIDPYEFEHFVGDLWERQGWATKVSQGSNDMGVDVVARKRDGVVNQKMVIQAKRYAEGNKVGRPKVQQYHSLKEQDPEADAAVVVTTSEFTNSAEVWANSQNVKLVDGEDLATLVENHGAEDLVDRYHEPSSSSSGSGQSSSSSETSKSSPTEPSESESVDLPDPADLVESPGEFFRQSTAKISTEASRRTHQILFSTVAIQTVAWLKVFKPDALMAITSDQAIWLLIVGWFGMGPAIYFDARKTREKRSTAMGYGFAAWMLPILSIGLYFYYVDNT